MGPPERSGFRLGLSSEGRCPKARRSFRGRAGPRAGFRRPSPRHAPFTPLPTAPQEANYYGPLTQAGTVSLGLDAEGKEVFVPFSSLLPMVAPGTTPCLTVGGALGRGGAGRRGRGLGPGRLEATPQAGTYLR